MANPYRLDRSAFQIQSFEQASNQHTYWLSKTPAERISAAWYLICVAYDLDYESEHSLDRTFFQMRKRA
jgi:uncharacterized protein (UPF0262 family)